MKLALVSAAPLLALLAACQSVADEQPSDRLAQASLRLANGQPAGTAQVLANGSQVNVTVALTGISPGVHGMHLHTTGSCDAPEFTSAGAHLNPGHREHGTDNPAGSHLGDLPNVTIGANGTGSASATLHGTRDEVLAQLFDADGTAIVVHASADDYRTDPSGNSGGRIACGVLTRS
ncbi:superoxide dismutase family protein [Croceibacterium sp. LX-88]|jgi:Cu-Zn family superoxide dismutase|uniref:Superoxide dismutase family protein n=1 Tax=Croceibacterium selenioxidans TaxID=2838833 RepID=A0ABS5W5U8_9SPHN|nr:superoxide dismutase family protein [Croceibacterium selenioxidans]MBT2135122.1 superoxide dismutase family protein [Croceibacterium selenioxidans]